MARFTLALMNTWNVIEKERRWSACMVVVNAIKLLHAKST